MWEKWLFAGVLVGFIVIAGVNTSLKIRRKVSERVCPCVWHDPDPCYVCIIPIQDERPQGYPNAEYLKVH